MYHHFAVRGVLITIVVFWNSLLMASAISTGNNGIDSVGLTLANGMPMNGTGVVIGQVESGRAGKDMLDRGFDDAAHSSRDVVPADVFVKATSGSTIANLFPTDHAEEVASVIIGKDTTDPDGPGPGSAPTGVALGTSLNSASFGTPNTEREFANTTDSLIASTIGMRAINISYGFLLASGHTYDGNQFLTQFVDWSAANQNVLYIVAGNQGNMTPIPKDNFNGITVARSIMEGGMYRRVSPGNVFDGRCNW
jgi:hypothetical protein